MWRRWRRSANRPVWAARVSVSATGARPGTSVPAWSRCHTGALCRSDDRCPRLPPVWTLEGGLEGSGTETTDLVNNDDAATPLHPKRIIAGMRCHAGGVLTYDRRDLDAVELTQD